MVEGWCLRETWSFEGKRCDGRGGIGPRQVEGVVCAAQQLGGSGSRRRGRGRGRGARRRYGRGIQV